jgi:hypothetical protein
MSNPMIEQQLKTYCGMSKTQADAFMALYQGKVIHFNQFLAFVGSGLATRQADPTNKLAHQLTESGLLMLARIASIEAGSFSVAPSKFTPEELTALSGNVTRLTRMKMPKMMGLRSAHLKALIAVARQPGIVLRSLLEVYDASTLGLLMSKSIIGRADEQADIKIKHMPLYPLMQGLSILNWCLNELELEVE